MEEERAWTRDTYISAGEQLQAAQRRRACRDGIGSGDLMYQQIARCHRGGYVPEELREYISQRDGQVEEFLLQRGGYENENQADSDLMGAGRE